MDDHKGVFPVQGLSKQEPVRPSTMDECHPNSADFGIEYFPMKISNHGIDVVAKFCNLIRSNLQFFFKPKENNPLKI